jgi:rhodanese-related sulfurtransferase
MIAMHRIELAVVLLAVAGALPPLIVYWTFLERTPTVSPEAAREILSSPKSNAVLVDVRPPEEFAQHHLDAAQNWSYDQIITLASATDVPEALRGKRLLLLCESGILSSLAARHLCEIGVPNVENVQGGMQNWVAAAEKPCSLSPCRIRANSGRSEPLPSRPSPPFEQWVAVLTGFVVKPLYTFLSLVLVVVLWRQTAPDLAALRWAMICFFVGENFCAANYLICSDGSWLFEYLHSYGMVLCFALMLFALFEGLDARVLKLSDPTARCAAVGLCQRCIKQADVPCGLRQIFRFLIPALMVVSLAPLCAGFNPISYNTTILGTFYNYSHAVVHQVFEIRYLPVAACVLLGTSLLFLRTRDAGSLQWPKLLMAAGLGAMGFSFFRLVLLHCYRDNLVWFATWEEVTEMLFILGVICVLWTFRNALLRKST